MPEILTNIELSSIDIKSGYQVPLVSQITNRLQEQSVYVETPIGKIYVTIQGDRTKHAFVTYHDIGLNSNTQFHGFFNFDEMEPLMQSFCAYHINAPGQEDCADPLPANYLYPTLEQLSECVGYVIDHFKLNNVILMGIGLGANVLARYALNVNSKANGLLLVNCVTTKCGWIEWAYQKWNNWYLSSGQFTAFTQNYLLWHHFGYHTWEKNHDLIQTYSHILTKGIHPFNLSLLISSYLNRTDLGIMRQEDGAGGANGNGGVLMRTFNFRCQVMNVVGDDSPHIDDVVDTNGRLNPQQSALVKFADCGGMVLEEQPAKMAESIRYFLQGLGYVTHLSITKHSLAYRLSKQSMDQHKQFPLQQEQQKEIESSQNALNV